jgi:alanine dehydrogenase
MNESSHFQELLAQQGIQPMEAMSWTKKNAKSIHLGIPKETNPDENRIALSPQAVQLLVANGHEILIEKSAGERAGFSDADYLLAGAQVTEELSSIWKSDLVIKIQAPSADEIAQMKPGKSLISCASHQHMSGEILDLLNAKKILALGLEYAEDNGGGFPFVKIMAEIAGQLILPIASELLHKKGSPGILLGNVTGVPPCHLVLLGSGEVVEQIARSAWHAGIQIQVFDKDIYKL